MHSRRYRLASALVAGAVAAACGNQPPTLPTSAAISVARTEIPSAAAEASPRSGALHVVKECSMYTGLAGSSCTITSSNLKGIAAGSRVVYAKALDGTSLNTDVVVYPPGPGNNHAFGHVVLDLAARTGTVTFSGGTGQFTHLHATAAITYVSGVTWEWNGTYEFSE